MKIKQYESKWHKSNFNELDIKLSLFSSANLDFYNKFYKEVFFRYNNFDDISGISFLPYSDHTFVQPPYEQITEEQYNEMVENFPTEFDWNLNEADDFTEGAQTLACVGGACEL